MKMALCYIQEYAGGLSMRQQQRILQKAARKLGWRICDEYISEAGSELAPIALRPEMQNMLKDAAEYQIDAILVVDQGHLACEKCELEGLLATLLQNDVHLFAVRTGCWIEPAGRHWMWLPGFDRPEDDDDAV